MPLHLHRRKAKSTKKNQNGAEYICDNKTSREGKMLNVTNGDYAAQLLSEGGIEGDILPWRDCLHLGPVPANLSLSELSQLRADYLSRELADSGMDIHHEMQQRDQRLIHAIENNEPITLWFEHDLYDQLQLLQIVDALADCTDHGQLQLICIDHFPGIEPFHGLGQLTPQQIISLKDQACPLTTEQLQLAKIGWQAVRSPDPQQLVTYQQLDLSALPFMKAAITRLMEEYPSIENGLSRTEQQTLQQLVDGPLDPFRLFEGNQQMEEARFMGDWGYWGIIQPLTIAERPLLTTITGAAFECPPRLNDMERFRTQQLQLTSLGREVLTGKQNRGQLDSIDYWVGGVHLNNQTTWRWNRHKGILEQKA